MRADASAASSRAARSGRPSTSKLLLRADPNGADDEAIISCAGGDRPRETSRQESHADSPGANPLEQWRRTPPAHPTAQTDDGRRRRAALVETLDVAGERKCWTRSSRRCARGACAVFVAAAPHKRRGLRDRTWNAVIGVADLDGGARFAPGEYPPTGCLRRSSPRADGVDHRLGGVLEGPRGLGVHDGLRRGAVARRCAAAAGPRALLCPFAKRRRRLDPVRAAFRLKSSRTRLIA